ncbi:hypothetical protein AYO40_03590 [Planctomycetaceae bacterium SCGC AG-212-D15]|nr:hypothetical protein AYO40_03590 [Planctomycetaceae bacterium SCGC AG-212-D15]
MFKREYACPGCKKKVFFLPLVRYRSCPHCGRQIMDWDGKQGEDAVPSRFNWRAIALVVFGVAAIVLSFLFFRARGP